MQRAYYVVIMSLIYIVRVHMHKIFILFILFSYQAYADVAKKIDVAEFYKEIQKLVDSNNSTLLSKIIRYPIYDSQNNKVSNEQQFIDRYDEIFTPIVKKELHCFSSDQILYVGIGGIQTPSGSLIIEHAVYVGDSNVTDKLGLNMEGWDIKHNPENMYLRITSVNYQDVKCN